MGLLKRKDERTETIAVRVPASLKSQVEELREQSGCGGIRSDGDDRRNQ